jgi:diacylglycerol kinase (ATP)
MRAAAILGLGSSPRDLQPFQKNSQAEWIIGLPASSSHADVVLIFGGDGTIHRHLAALVDLKLPVLVVPCGSGNDFARALKLRNVKDSLAAWKKFSAGADNVRAIDLGRITPLAPDAATGDLNPDARNSRYFCCAGGAGLDGEIARRANRLPRWLRGHGGYVLSLLPAVAKYAPVVTRILLPSKEEAGRWELQSDARMFVAVFANAPDYGGGMKIAPRASLDDGLLDICTVSDLDKFRLFCLFPTVYFGRHLQVPEVGYFQTPGIRIETGTPLAVYADGEHVCQTPIEVSAVPRALRIIGG